MQRKGLICRLNRKYNSRGLIEWTMVNLQTCRHLGDVVFKLKSDGQNAFLAPCLTVSQLSRHGGKNGRLPQLWKAKTLADECK